MWDQSETKEPTEPARATMVKQTRPAVNVAILLEVAKIVDTLSEKSSPSLLLDQSSLPSGFL